MGDISDTLYREMYAMARKRLMGQRAGHTLQPTALVNEAWLKMRNHFDMARPSAEFFGLCRRRGGGDAAAALRRGQGGSCPSVVALSVTAILS